MRRGGSLVLVAVMAVAGLAAGIFVAAGGASSKASHATARLQVQALEAQCSDRDVVFTVTNKGTISHDFKIAGKKTPLLSPRRSARLGLRSRRRAATPTSPPFQVQNVIIH